MKLLVCTLFLAAAVIPMKSQADGKREFPDSGDVESTEDEKLSPPELPWETRSGKAWGNLRNHGEHSGSSEDRALSLKGNFLVGRTSLTQRRWHSKHQGSRLIRSILGDAKCAYKNGAPERSKINAPSLEMDSHDHSQDRQPPPTGITLWPSEILPALPCPQHCVCNHTAVNCSGAGLTEVPRAGSCPLHTEILDLSRNRITHLRPDAFADFKDLKKIKFGFNSYKYDCSLAWLKDWLAQGSLTVLDSEDVRCSQPSSAFDVLVNMLDSAVSPCADSFVSCVPNPHSLSDAVLLYLRCEPQVRDKKSCEALCRHRGYSHYALDPARHCLCGTLAPPASVQAQACSGVCSNIVQTVVCGRTIIHTAFPVLVSLEIVTAPWHSLYQPVELSVSAALPVFQWEFGDGSRPYNTTNTRVLYKYALPGTYKVDVHAMMGGYQLSLSVFVKVVMPLGQVQLEYPLQAETLNTLNFLVHIDKGTDLSAMWSVKDTRGKETTVHSICPRGSRIHLTNMHCYWLVQTQESWQDARRTCQQTTGGDLAVVSSADIQSFLQQTFPLTDNVWIGLRDGTSVKPVWVDGAPADVFHNWGNANKNQKGCVQMMMSLMGLWKSTDCGTKIPFICEKHTSALLPGPDTFLAGVPVMTGVYKVNNLSVLPAPPGLGQSNVEVMLFPGLWFSHAGRVVSVEFVIQPIKNQTRARVQVLRPYCSPSQHLVPPGCSVLLNPFACCSTEPLCNTTGGCARGQQWCHLQDSCQPLSSPCSSYTPQGQSFGRPPRHTATPPFYHLVADLPLSLPHSSEQVHVNVLLLKREINIFPDDILAVQHDAGAGSFLQCPRSDDSPWRQSYLSLRRTGWLEGGVSAQPSQSVWVDEVVCDLRVLYSDSLQGYAVTSPLGTGHRDPGSYTYSIAVSNPVSSTTACCTVDVRTPVWGLQIIHPLPVGGMIHIPVNKPTLIVIKILSGVNATSSWSAPVLRSGIAFSSSCPSALLAYVPGCTRTTPDTWFSYAYATVALPVSQILNISVSNGVSAQNLSVVLQSHQEVQGLRMKPQGDRRMLVDVSQEFRASVRSGSSVTYTWVIDDLILFAYHGQTYSVVFRKPAVYNLKVTAENPVSSESLDVKLTADLMKPLEDPVFLSVAEVMAVNTSQVFVFRVKVDVSIGVTFRWDFGDDIPAVSHSFSPPYDADQRKQIYLQDSASHIYTQPGNYSVRVEVFNSYDRTEKAVLVMVQSPLSGLSLFLTPAYPAVNQDFELRALPRPSTYGVCYLWNFADGSKEIKECNSKVSHTFKTAVLQSQLVALIKGGSHRVWAAQEDLLLDGSGSHDPDIVGGEDRDLQYFWSYAVQNTTVSSLRPSILNNSSTFILSRFNLQPNALYVFTLTVFKAGKLPASTTQSVMVRLGRVLPVNIQCRSCSALSSYRVSHSVHVVLSGQCKGCSNETLYEWTAEGSHGEVLELNNVSTTTGNSFPDLVIRKGVLQNGVHYNFTLSAAHPSKEFWGSASIILVPNYPPSGGICTLTPNSTIYLLETVVTYHCSGWMDEDGDLTQLIYTMHVEVCQHRYHQCHLLTLYRGTKSTFSTLVPVGSTESSSFSHISVLIEVEDALGGKVIALNSTLTVLLPVFPVESQGMMEWLTNKSQSKLWDMTQQSNPQEVIPYSIALTSMLNQIQNVNEWDRQDLIRIRSNITQVLTSLSMSTMHDVAQISSALAQCVVGYAKQAVPHEFVCGECKIKTLEATRKMIAMIEDKTVLGDDTPVSTGTNVLQILGGLMAAAGHSTDSSKIPEITASAFSLVGDLMRSLMRSRVPREEVLKLTAPEIRVMGHRSETADLMCTSPSSPCQFYIPKGLSNQLKEKREVVQILMKMDANLFSANPPISTELAAMEFSTPEGLPIPISNLSKENAIHVMLETQKGVDGTTALIINPQGSVNFTVKAIETNPKAGLFISFNFTLHPGLRPESSPMVRIFIDDHPAPSENQHLLRRDILLTSTSETSHVEETIFLSPLHNGTVWEYHVNISSLLVGQEVQASVCVFSSLCQYFSLEERRWSSQGLSPLNGSSLKTAHCLTKHLTVFGASLFVHHSALILLPPSEGPAQNHVVGIVCVILLVIYLATVLIAHKMDDIDITRVGTIPLCGQSGRYQYQVLVKTGWTRGSGTTAHVGISLYGLNKSGSRHLDREEAFQRNSLDVFQIETDANLGEVWKIRIWHDNTGLDPSWYLQYVIVWDKQTSNMFFFLVEDWLSVENETNEGMVEKEVLATCPQELLRFYRIFRTQLIRGIFDRHLWVSVWERLPRSRFTRTQRVTCCALTLFLYLGAGAVWYGAVGQRNSSGPVSAHMLVNAEIVAVGMTVAALVFPIQLLFIVLFRMTRSKVIVEDPESCVAAPQTVEMDVCLEHSELGSSSFLSLPGGLDSILDGVSESSESLESRRSESSLGIPAKQEHESSVNPWASCDSIFDIPDLLASEPSLNRARILKRKKALLQLSIESPASSADDPLVLSWSKPEVTQGLEQNQLTVSEEDLIKSIAADNVVQSTSSSRVTSDSGRYSPCADTELSDPLESSCSGWSEFSDERKPYSGQLHKTSSSISGLTSASSFIPSPSPASVCSMFSTRLGVPRRAPRRLFPPQVLSVTYLLALLVLGSSLAVAVLYGTTFHNSVVLMWLISTFSAFLTSAVLLEPAKVIVQSLFLALVMKPVDPDEDDTLVEEPVVKKVSERISKVRPPCGYGLLQAKEEARKVRALRTLMKSCIAHMMFLLVVLVVNYQDRLQGDHGRLLHSAVKRSLVAGSGEGMNVSMIRGAAEAWCWMQRNLVPHLYQNPSLQLLGVARLRRLQSGKGCWNHGIAGLTSRDISLHPTVHAWPNTHTWDLNFHQNISSNHRQPFPSNSFMWLWYLGQFGVYSSEEEVVDLGNSTESTRQLLAELSQASWINTMTRGVFVQFTQYHRDTGLFVVVTVLMEWHQPGSAITSLSILPVCMPSSSLVPDLQAVMMVVLLLLALSILGSELHTLSRERCLYFRQGWHYLQLLVVLLALGVAALHFAFLSLSASLLRHHCHNRHSFTNFHTAVALSEASSSLSAILLTILILKNVRQLRFVRRWAVFGKTIQLVWKELCGASLVLLLLFLILAQTGYLLFSDTVEEFRTFGWTCFSLASGLWGKTRLGIVAHRHPISGLLYLLTVLGGLMWVLRWLFGTMLIQSYRAIQTEMYRPSMGPQDYEMVEFFIKRFKLWIGISKTKEFRHKVKFEGMESLPSRSSHDSKMSEPVSCGLDPTRLGSALSLGSEDSSVSESSHSEDYDVCFYMDRLLPTVNNLLAQFDRVNKVIEDLYQIEVDLQKAQSQISEKRKQRKKSLIKQPTTAPPHLLPSLPPLSTVSGTLRLPRTHTTFSESALSRLRPHCSQVSDPGLFDNCVPVRRPSLMDTGVTRVPGRRAWNSGPSLSADITQRPYPPAGSTVRDRPKSEEGKRGQRSDQAPVKRRAWHHDGT
nr:PREDICTED: polycystin-1-like isoform X5 [Lepisosteus oculatus]